jgi:cell division protein FtsB
LSNTTARPSREKIRFVAPDRLIWLATAAILLWGVWAFGSEVVLNLRLGHQAGQLKAQNTQLAAENAQAQRDLASAASPSAMEEEARKYGFARPSENVYIIVKPSPSPAATAGAGHPGRSAEARAAGGVGGAWQAVVGWWKNLWH